jgi:putative peptidoglycan lipid II flippase
LLATPLVATIFFGGEFTVYDLRMTAVSLQAFSVGLLGFSLVKVLAPAYFARENTKTPVKIGVIALVVNVLLSVLLAWTLTVMNYEATHAGLAMATSVSAVLNAWLLYIGLRRDRVVTHGAGWPALLLRILVANLAMVVLLLWIARPIEFWTGASLADRSVWLGITVAAAVTLYFVALLLLGLRPRHLRLGN